MKKENKNELMVIEPINFNELNVSIEALGENRALSDKEKEIGVNLLKEWEVNVIEKIDNKRYELEKIKWFFTNTSYHLEDEQKEKLAKFAGTEKLFGEYVDMRGVVKNLELTCPVRPKINPNITVAENDLNYGEYEAQLTKFNVEKSKIEYKKAQAYIKWFSATRKSPSIKKLLIELEDYLVKVNKYKVEARDKAHLAKINISISDVKIRDAIREIVEFTKRIK